MPKTRKANHKLKSNKIGAKTHTHTSGQIGSNKEIIEPIQRPTQQPETRFE